MSICRCQKRRDYLSLPRYGRGLFVTRVRVEMDTRVLLGPACQDTTHRFEPRRRLHKPMPRVYSRRNSIVVRLTDPNACSVRTRRGLNADPSAPARMKRGARSPSGATMAHRTGSKFARSLY